MEQEQKGTILENMTLKFRKSLYPKEALLKASYNFIDKAFIHLDADDEYYFVNIDRKADDTEVSEKEFENEMLTQSVRHEVYLETKNIRELLLARALATSVVADTDSNVSDDINDKYTEEDILKDWFSTNDGTET